MMQQDLRQSAGLQLINQKQYAQRLGVSSQLVSQAMALRRGTLYKNSETHTNPATPRLVELEAMIAPASTPTDYRPMWILDEVERFERERGIEVAGEAGGEAEIGRPRYRPRAYRPVVALEGYSKEEVEAALGRLVERTEAGRYRENPGARKLTGRNLEISSQRLGVGEYEPSNRQQIANDLSVSRELIRIQEQRVVEMLLGELEPIRN